MLVPFIFRAVGVSSNISKLRIKSCSYHLTNPANRRVCWNEVCGLLVLHFDGFHSVPRVSCSMHELMRWTEWRKSTRTVWLSCQVLQLKHVGSCLNPWKSPSWTSSCSFKTWRWVATGSPSAKPALSWRQMSVCKNQIIANFDTATPGVVLPYLCVLIITSVKIHLYSLWYALIIRSNFKLLFNWKLSDNQTIKWKARRSL